MCRDVVFTQHQLDQGQVQRANEQTILFEEKFGYRLFVVKMGITEAVNCFLVHRFDKLQAYVKMRLETSFHKRVLISVKSGIQREPIYFGMRRTCFLNGGW